MAKSQKVLLLVDLIEKPPWDQDYSKFLDQDDWETENHVLETLKSLGYEVKIFGVFDDIVPLVQEIQNNPPDVVFNMCESFKNRREFEPNVIAVLDLLGIKYTGSGAFSLSLCQDKGLTKKILSYHKISVPGFVVSYLKRPLRTLKKFKYPAIIKPLGLEASEGIAQVSFAENEKECLERIRFVHESLQADAIIEEYIEGRELYVGVLGMERPKTLPIRELLFSEVPEGEPTFATYKAKWDEDYQEKWGIYTDFARSLPDHLEKKIDKTCKKIFKLLQLRSYARIDLRLKPSGECYFLEANPNPGIADHEEFPLAAEKAGMKYQDLIKKLLTHAGVGI